MTKTIAVTNNPLVRLLISPLPVRMKRIMFLASLMAVATGSNVPEKRLIAKLNKVLKLSSTGDSALKLPIHLSQLIWANQTIFKDEITALSNCHHDDIIAKQSAERIVMATPKWFSYGTLNELVEDILQLFTRDNYIINERRASEHNVIDGTEIDHRKRA